MQSERDQRLIRIVEAALREAPELRASYIQNASAGDDALVAEAEDLLAQTDSGGQMLTSWAAAKAAELVCNPLRLEQGDRLGPYQVERKFASGGMGDVYEATDLRLNRRVAVKVLTGASTDMDSRASILQEARILSRLNHPFICTIHDVGVYDGVPYLVMELLEGVSLRDALNKERPAVAVVLQWAINIAEALHHAHLRGVVHRDVKPENVVITRTGAKLVDFGISGLTTADASGMRPAGTMPYMAPELFSGERATQKSDMFAFGAMLREMFSVQTKPNADNEAAAGRFVKPNVDLPESLHNLIEACLTPDSADRWESAADAAATLRWIRQGAFQVRRDVPATNWLHIAVPGIVFIALGIAWLLLRPKAADDRAISFTVDAEPGTALKKPVEMAVAPDGKSLGFIAFDRGTTHIYVRPLKEAHARRLSGSENARNPFWSPDSTTLAFFADGKLKRIPAAGGPAVIVCDAPQASAGSWGTRRTVLFSGSEGPVYKVDAAGGTPRSVTTLEARDEDYGHRWPAFLPDGVHFLYTARSNRHEGKLYVGTTMSATASYVLDTPAQAVFARGLLFCLRGSSLIARQFDTSSLRTFGDTIPIAERVGRQSFSASATGVVAFWDRVTTDPASLAWVDRSGKLLGHMGQPAYYTGVVLAPAGDAVAATVCDSIDCQDPTNVNYVRRYNLRLLNGTGKEVAITNDEAVAATPVWSPSGDELVFGSTRSGHMDLYRRQLATGVETRLLPGGVDRGVTSWSSDGRYIAYTELQRDTAFDIWILDLRTGKRTRFRGTTANETMAAFSPDGRWIAYASDESGRWAIYIAPFSLRAGSPRDGERVADGFLPLWRGDGSELYYYSATDLMAVNMTRLRGRLQPGTPHRLFSLRRIGGMGNSYAVSRDGMRFLILDGPTTIDAPITVQIP